MKKKAIMRSLFFLTFSISLSFISVSAFSEEIESEVTVRIIHGDTLEPEKSKESTNESSKQNHKETHMKLNKINKLPQLNERVNSSISIIGLLATLLGVVGIYINNKRNGENKK